MKYLFFIGFTCFVLIACDRNSTGVAERLPAPTLLAPPMDTAFQETGIDAVDDTIGIRIEWEQGGEEQPEIYHIFRRTGNEVEGEFEYIGGLSGNKTYFDDKDVKVGTRYYYYVTAHSGDADEESEPSNIEHYLLLEKPDQLWNTSSSKPKFTWSVASIHDSYVLKIIDLSTNQPVWIGTIQSSYGNPEEIDCSSLPGFPELDTQGNYKWRVDIVGAEQNSGSESNWNSIVF